MWSQNIHNKNFKEIHSNSHSWHFERFKISVEEVTVEVEIAGEPKLGVDTKWSRSNREEEIVYNIPYMWNLRINDTHELTYKTERDSQT